jgi:hypothetical protein
MILLAAFTMFASLAAVNARAQSASTEMIPDHPALNDRFAFELGAYYSNSSTAASLGQSIRISTGYSFFKRRDKELGVGIGLHVAGIKTSIQSAGIGAESTDVLAPLPVLNLYGAFALTNEWAVRMRMDWLSLSYDEYSGDIRGTAIDVLYRSFRHVGFGVGLRTLIVDVEIDSSDWRGKARTAFSGPTAFMSVSF